jgi:hypothetical protein
MLRTVGLPFLRLHFGCLKLGLADQLCVLRPSSMRSSFMGVA